MTDRGLRKTGPSVLQPLSIGLFSALPVVACDKAQATNSPEHQANLGHAIFTALSQLKELLHYDPETGIFTWLRARRGVRAGGIAGSINSQGYRGIEIDSQRFQAHRLAWFYQTGEWPVEEIDHIDGNRANNAWGNLREANRSQNNANRVLQKNNTTGFKGVRRMGKRFQVEISVKGKKHHLGTFDTPELAHAAYVAAAHNHFGEFARFE